jgi:hypothetical protein
VRIVASQVHTRRTDAPRWGGGQSINQRTTALCDSSLVFGNSARKRTQTDAPFEKNEHGRHFPERWRPSPVRPLVTTLERLHLHSRDDERHEL